MAPGKSTARGKPQSVPKLIIKGGVEVLAIKTGPDSVFHVEAYLNPRMGREEDAGAASDRITVADNIATDRPQKPEIPCWSCGRIQLPILNTDMTCQELLMWEAVAVKTEVVGITSLLNAHSGMKRVHGGGAGLPVEGHNLHMFAVGGEPLELQGLQLSYQAEYLNLKNLPHRDKLSQVINPKNKGVLDLDGMYPVEAWGPDPSRNENTRYFGSYTGGATTPPVLQCTNTMTTVLLDEQGVGPLCKGDGLFLSCVDICGFYTRNDGAHFWRGLPRYFNVQLRKRLVKNPYPVSSLLSSLFTGLNPKITGQPMEGTSSQVEEVRVYQGEEPLPSDPDMRRYIDKFGEQKTAVPSAN
ncbi:VP1 [Bofec polyomavirus LSFL22]|nr:VP1 [Bofec polyomavirus LSFL22]